MRVFSLENKEKSEEERDGGKVLIDCNNTPKTWPEYM